MLFRNCSQPDSQYLNLIVCLSCPLAKNCVQACMRANECHSNAQLVQVLQCTDLHTLVRRVLIVCAALVQVALLGWLASMVVDTSLSCACCQNTMTQGTALFELPMAPTVGAAVELVHWV